MCFSDPWNCSTTPSVYANYDSDESICSGISSKVWADFASDNDKCAAVGCSYSASVNAKCEGNNICSTHTTSSSDCTGTIYSWSSTCTWTAPSCTSINTNNNTNNNYDDNGVKINKISKVIFVIFALLF